MGPRVLNGDDTLGNFHTHGWMRVRAAFSVDQAAAMRAVVWRALAAIGIDQHNRSTWTKERPEHLQHVKGDAAFQAVGSARLLKTIDSVLEGQAYETPQNWGACFLAFPSTLEWNVPSRGWHVDANYVSALAPPAGIRMHALFGDVAPRGGSTLIVSGSHRLVHQYFKDNPAPAGARGADYRKRLRAHPYLRDLHAEGHADQRVARFVDRDEEHGGIALRVVENIGVAGDVILLHPLVLHVAATNTSDTPRFMLSGGIDLPSMWFKQHSIA
jgi:hypothetical protein